MAWLSSQNEAGHQHRDDTRGLDRLHVSATLSVHDRVTERFYREPQALGCRLLLAHPRPSPPGTFWALAPDDFPLPFVPRSKQRHNKLWRQQSKTCLQQPVDDPAGSGDFLPETLDGTPEARLPCLDDASQPGFPDSGAPGGPTLPCCFRRLSDPLLHSPNDETGSVVHLEDLERDAVLEEVAELTEAHTPPRHPQEASGLCEKEVKKKLEFGSPKARSGSSPQVEEMEGEEAPGAGQWGRPLPQLDKGGLNRENLNNNNSKRSCPDDFEVGKGGRRRGSGHDRSMAAGVWECRCLALIPAGLLPPPPCASFTAQAELPTRSLCYLHKM